MSKFYLRAVTVLFISIFFLNSCNIYKYTPAKDNPVKGIDRAKKMLKRVEEFLPVTFLKEVELITNLVLQIQCGGHR